MIHQLERTISKLIFFFLFGFVKRHRKKQFLIEEFHARTQNRITFYSNQKLRIFFLMNLWKQFVLFCNFFGSLKLRKAYWKSDRNWLMLSKCGIIKWFCLLFDWICGTRVQKTYQTDMRSMRHSIHFSFSLRFSWIFCSRRGKKRRKIYSHSHRHATQQENSLFCRFENQWFPQLIVVLSICLFFTFEMQPRIQKIFSK